MKYDIQQINSLTNDEYLQFLIDVHYSNYEDKNILLGVYDVKKRKKFSTKLSKKLFKFSDDECLNFDFNQQPLLNMFPSLSIVDEMFDLILKTGNGYCCIIFDKLDGRFGAMHARIDPIFKNSEICGFVNRSYNFTKLFFGVGKLADAPAEMNKKSITGKELEVLSSRQKQILFLSLIDFTQEQIANSLHVTRGTIVKTIANICEKLTLETTSLQSLLNVFDRSSFLKALSLPNIAFEPVAIIMPHDLEAHWTQL